MLHGPERSCPGSEPTVFNADISEVALELVLLILNDIIMLFRIIIVVVRILLFLALILLVLLIFLLLILLLFLVFGLLGHVELLEKVASSPLIPVGTDVDPHAQTKVNLLPTGGSRPLGTRKCKIAIQIESLVP